MASKSYTLLEYLVTIETELKKLKKIVAESVGADYSELITQINGIGQELNSFKSSITDTVNTNNSEITSKFNSLEQQFNTFKTNISNTVNSNKTEITSQVNTLNTNFNDFKTSIESQVSSLNTRVTSVERRVTTLENSGGSSGGTVDLTEVNNRINNLETKHDSFESSTKVKFTTTNSNISKVENNFNSFKNTTNSNIESINTRITALESNSGSSGSIGGTTRTLIHDYTVTEGTILNITALDTSTGQFTTDTTYDLTQNNLIVTPCKKEGVNYLIGDNIPKFLQNLSNAYITNVIDNTFKIGNTSSYDRTGDFTKYGLLVGGVGSVDVSNIFEANKNYEIEIYTAQPYYNTVLRLNKCVTSFDYNKGYVIGGEQYSTYLNSLPLKNAEGINCIKHKIKLYNYVSSFKLEIDSIYDGLNSNSVKYNTNKIEYHYNGNIMHSLSYMHYRNHIAKGTTIKIYDLGGN